MIFTSRATCPVKLVTNAPRRSLDLWENDWQVHELPLSYLLTPTSPSFSEYCALPSMLLHMNLASIVLLIAYLSSDETSTTNERMDMMKKEVTSFELSGFWLLWWWGSSCS